MKNFTNNFKQFTSRLSARWLIMALMLLVGTSSAWGKSLYLSPGVWDTASAWFGVWAWGAGDKFYKATKSGDYYKVDVPDGTTGIQWFRMNSSSTHSSGYPTNQYWNRTNDVTVSNGNLVTITGWGSNTDICPFSQSNYNPCNPATLSWKTISTSMKVDGTQTISTNLTSGAGSVTYTSSDENVITVSGAKLTAVGTGTARITANHSTVISGYCEASSIFQDITVTCDIVNKEEIQIQVKCTSGAPNIYAWDTSGTLTAAWPGDAMQSVQGSTNTYIWTYKPSTDKISVIFNKNGSQTGDITELAIGLKHKFEYDGSTTATNKGFECLSPSCTPADVTIQDWNISTLCPGSSGTFTYTAAQGATVTWKMYQNNSDYTIVSNNGTVTITYNGTSTINSNKLLYTVSGNGICPETDVDSKKTISAATKPSISASTSTTQTICSGSKATLTVTSGKGTYNWVSSNGGEEITLTSNSVEVGTAGTYTVTATQNGCESEPIEFTVLVTPVPTINDFDINLPNNPTYNGSAHNAIVVPKSGITGMGDVNISYYKGGQKTDPINAGEYTVKISVAAGDSYCAMNETQIGTFTISPKTPDENDFEYTDQKVTYNGNAYTANVTWKQSYDKKGDITVLYNNSKEEPTNVGTYTITVTSAASDNFNATAYAIEKGTLTIECAEITDVANNFELSKTQYNYDEEAKPEVSLKQNSTLKQAGLGAITTKYYNSSDQEVANPTAVGTYTAKISIAAGTGYCALNETTVGTFTITCPTPAQPQLTISDKVKVCEGKPNTDGNITISNFNSYTNCKFYLGSVSNENEIKSNTVAVNNAETYTIIVENACGESSQSSIKIGADVLTPTLTDITIESSAALVCAGDNNVTLTCNLVGAVGTPTYKWTKNGEPVGDNSNTIEAGVLERNTTFSVSVILDNSGCTKEFTVSKELEVKVRPEAPNLGSTGETICYGTLVNLPMVDKNDANNQINWYNGKLVKPTNVPVLETTTFYAEAVSENGLGCPSNDKTPYTVTVNALPTITLTANNTNVNVGETVTLTAAGSNFTSLDWSSTGGTLTPGNNTATLTSAEDANITVTVTATSKDGCTATATIQVIFGSEDCEAESSANYIEVLCRTTGGTRDMYCYAWTGSNTEKLGAWPGQKAKDGDYTYDGTTYAYWKIEGDAINIIFNNGSGTKTGDITGLEKGKRYVFTISTNYQTVTKTVDGESIFMPEVETTSITPVRNGNTTNVTLEGRVVKKGCANIVWYGFQYSTDGGDTYKDIKVGETDLELGRIFNHTQAFALGTYMFRAKMINNNGSKVYGEPVRVTVAERDLSIAAVHNDVSVDTGTYYDFVGLYMSSISKPTNVDIVSYTWYKDGAIYNPTFTESSLYGDTYINSNGTNNIRPNQTGTYKLVVALSNGATLESNEINITKGSKVSASSILDASNRTLPVISVRTNEDFPACKSESFPSAQASNLKKKRSVDVKIFDKDGNLYYDRKARMNYRGSSSLNFVKKSYAFCPGDEMCGDVEKGLDYVITKKVNMFNLGAKDKDWVLYAAAADPSMMRNRIVFDTYANMTGEWGVKSMYVELVVDGEYKGVYVFMDKITNNKDRVNITNAAGFIVKFDKTDKEDRYVNGQDDDSDEKTFVTSRTGKKDIPTYGTTVDQMFEIEYPEKDDNKANWSNIVTSIQKRFENFETALEKGDYATVRSIIDYTSWADWFILNEYIKNQDAYRASCIFVYNGEKIEARPVWDQELSFNNTCHTSHNCGSTSNLLIQTASIYSDAFPAPFWFTGGNENITGGLLKDGCFVSLVKERWATHVADGMPLNSETLTALLNKFDGELTKDNGTSDLNTAQKREAQYWSGKSRSKASCGNGDTGYGNPTYDIEKGNISEWINGNRSENLSAILEDMKGELSGGISITMNPANGTVTPWIPVKVTVNVDEGTKYTYDDKSITTGITEDTDKAIVSSQGNVYTYTFPRPESWGTGNDNGNTKDTRSYIINAALVDQSTECPGLSTEAIVQVKLADEGDDYCTE